MSLTKAYTWQAIATNTDGFSSFEAWLIDVNTRAQDAGTVFDVIIGSDATLVNDFDMTTSAPYVNIFAFVDGAKIKGQYDIDNVTPVFTLTVGKMTADPIHQIFDDTVDVVFADNSCRLYRPDWFGVYPIAEDDRVDCSENMQKCVDAIPMGGLLKLRGVGDGRYWFGGIVVTGKVFKIQGDGMNRTTIASLTDTADIITFDCSASPKLGLVLEGFDASYYGLGGVSAAHNGITLKNCVEPTIRDVHFGDSDKGLKIAGSGSYVATIANIDGCVFGSSNRIGLSLENQTNEHTRVHHSWFDENLYYGIYCNSKDVVIDHNSLLDNTTGHIYIDSSADSVVVQGNLLARGSDPDTTIAITCNGSNCIIEGNIIERHNNYSADVILGTNSNGNIVQNNHTAPRINGNDRISDVSTTGKLLIDNGGTWVSTWVSGGSIATTIYNTTSMGIFTTTTPFDTDKDTTLENFANDVKFLNGMYRNLAYNTLAGGAFAQGDTVQVFNGVTAKGSIKCIYDNGTRMAFEEIDEKIAIGYTLNNGNGVTATIVSTVTNLGTFAVVKPEKVADCIYNAEHHTIKITPVKGQLYGGINPLSPLRLSHTSPAGGSFAPSNTISKTGGGWSATVVRNDVLSNEISYTVISGTLVDGDAFHNGSGVSAVVVSKSINNPVTVVLSGITGTLAFDNYTQAATTTATVRNTKSNLVVSDYDTRKSFSNCGDDGFTEQTSRTLKVASNENATTASDGALAVPVGGLSVGLDINCEGSIKIAGTKVVGDQVVSTSYGITPNTGDANTDTLISALVTGLKAHGLIA